MEQAVCDVCKDIRIGKILIQTNLSTGEPEVSFFFCHLLLQLLIFLLFLLRLPILICSIHVQLDSSISEAPSTFLLLFIYAACEIKAFYSSFAEDSVL